MLNKKLKKGILIFTLLALVFFVLPANIFGIENMGAQEAAAEETTAPSEGNKIAGFLAWVTLGIASLFGKLMTQVMGIVNWLFTWQDFETEGVVKGWVIVRDLCNMFFILVLLMIAFATILRLENYSMKKYLPKLLIMAVLINFSKTICLFLIDVSQIIMLTFGNAFAGASGNFVEMLHINDMLTISDNAEFGDMTWDMFYAAGLALVFMLIAFFVMVMMMGILIMRVIMFWVLIVLAPLAFLSTAVPGGGKYWSQWWGEFTKYLIVGPILAFFTWLSLTVASEAMNFGKLDISDQKGATDFITKISSAGTVESFILAIGLLIGAMKITMSIGAMGASYGANLASKAKVMGLGWGKKIGTSSFGGVKFGSDWLNRKQATVTGVDLNMSRQMSRIKASSERSKSRDLTAADIKASARLGKGGFTAALGGVTATGWADQHLRGFLGRKGIMSAFRGREKWVNEYRDKETDHTRKAGLILSQDEYNKQKQELISKRSGASPKEEQKIFEKLANLESLKAKAEKENLFYSNKGEADKNKNIHKNSARKYNKLASKYTVNDYYGQRARRQAENEEAGKITSTNEDELISQFQNAVAQGNQPLASALSRAIAKIGGFNALLDKNDYQAQAGLTEKEANSLSEKEREKRKGFNDFMRDTFRDKLKMDKQSMLELQSDLGGIGENINHEYLIKTVKVNDYGKFEQSSGNERSKIITTEKSKMEREGVIRKANRLNYGAEDRDTGLFNWSDSGMVEFVNNWRLIGKEINNGRFNRSTASKIAESEEAVKKLKDTLTKSAKAGVLSQGFEFEKGVETTPEMFIEKLKEYTVSSTSDNSKKLFNIVQN